MPIPVVDDRIKHVGVNTLRRLNTQALRDLKEMLVVQFEGEAIAVLLPYQMYMELQQILWPTSLLPDWKSSPVVNLIADDENGGTEPNPDMQHSMDAYQGEKPTMVISNDIDTEEESAEIQEKKAATLDHDPDILVFTTPFRENSILERVTSEPTCDHCGKPSGTPICGPCYVAGHRGHRNDCGECSKKEVEPSVHAQDYFRQTED